MPDVLPISAVPTRFAKRLRTRPRLLHAMPRRWRKGWSRGIKQQRTINVNKAKIEDLKSLPGIDDATAQRIIDHRPYSESYDMVKRRVISREQYNRIAGKIEAR